MLFVIINPILTEIHLKMYYCLSIHTNSPYEKEEDCLVWNLSHFKLWFSEFIMCILSNMFIDHCYCLCPTETGCICWIYIELIKHYFWYSKILRYTLFLLFIYHALSNLSLAPIIAAVDVKHFQNGLISISPT